MSFIHLKYDLIIKTFFIYYTGVFYTYCVYVKVLIVLVWFGQTKPRRDLACSNRKVNKVVDLVPAFDKRLSVLFLSRVMKQFTRRFSQEFVNLPNIRKFYAISQLFKRSGLTAELSVCLWCSRVCYYYFNLYVWKWLFRLQFSSAWFLW